MTAKFAALLICVFLLASVPVFAHHSFATEYDSAKSITLKGSVTKFDLRNPHSWLYIDVRDAKGKVESWGIELGTVHDLRSQGLSKNSIPTGAEVTIEGFLAKNGSSTANANTVRLPDGRMVFSKGLAPVTTTSK